MSESHSVRIGTLEARLSRVQMDIDDDDEDVVIVSIDMTNEAAIPLGGLEIFIHTSDGKKVESTSGISSLGPGLTRSFDFEFPLESGNWTYSVQWSGQSLSLGPYEHDFAYEAEKARAFGNSIGSSLFSGAFDANLDAFGQVEEREIIDPSSIVLTSYHGENAQGGATTINLGKAETVEEDAPRTPPWEQPSSDLLTPVAPADDVLLAPAASPETDILLSVPVAAASEPSVEPASLLAPEPSVEPASLLAPESVPEPVAVASTPPPLPSTPPPTPPSTGPPSGPPTGPPTGPPSGPPTGPPSGPPTGPPSGPPSGPPTGPPSGPPTGSPSGPPSGPPTGPPSGPPSEAPQRPDNL